MAEKEAMEMARWDDEDDVSVRRGTSRMPAGSLEKLALRTFLTSESTYPQETVIEEGITGTAHRMKFTVEEHTKQDG